MTVRVRAPRVDGLPRQCVSLMLVMDWALNRRSVLEVMAICVSKCAPNVADGTSVKSGVSWAPDGISLIHVIHQEQSLMVTCFSKLLFLLCGLLLVVVLCVLIQHLDSLLDFFSFAMLTVHP